jgi:hypothetical protein
LHPIPDEHEQTPEPVTVVEEDPFFLKEDNKSMSLVLAREEVRAVMETQVEVSVRGEWSTIPALSVNGTKIVVTGKWLRVAQIHDEQWIESKREDPEACLQVLRERHSNALRADIFTFSQKLPALTPLYPYPMELDSVAAIRITSFKDWWAKLPQVSRKNVRRSQKRGVEVSVRSLDDDLVRDIVELNRDSPIRQGTRFVHYGKSFEETKKDQSTFLDRSDFICAYSGNELVGLLKIVYAGGNASILQFLPKASQQDKRPANALIAKAVEICEEKSVRYFVYGMFGYGNKRQSSLLEFKIRNGFEEFLVPRFYVPVSGWGALCLRLKLHRGMVGVLPTSVINAGVGVRAKWHSIAGSSGRCSSMPEQPNRIRQTERSNPPAGSNHDPDE